MKQIPYESSLKGLVYAYFVFGGYFPYYEPWLVLILILIVGYRKKNQ